jgi:ferredoxin-NADP reductase
MWLEKQEGFSHKPGQYCTIGLEGIERAYSISSAPYEEAIELFIELVPRGRRKPHASALQAQGRRHGLHTTSRQGSLYLQA